MRIKIDMTRYRRLRLRAGRELAIESIAALASCLFVGSSIAASGTWSANPINNDFNTAANWSSDTVPGASDTATFGVSTQTDVSNSGTVGVFEIVFQIGASQYQLTCSPGQTFSINNLSTGIDNESSVTQSLIAAADTAGQAGTVEVGASIVGAVHFTSEGALISGGGAGAVQLISLARASSSSVFETNGGVVSGAAGGDLGFYNASNANAATITNNAGVAEGASGGTTTFWFGAGANRSIITSQGASLSGAGGGTTIFHDNSHAGKATLIANGGGNGGAGGSIQLTDNSSGGKSQVEVFGNGSLDISAHARRHVEIGSLQGDGQVFLGTRRLTVGGNDLDTTFSGILQGDGSIEKVGIGSLTLTGANTYGGPTVVTAGTLLINNATDSGTGMGLVKVEGGTLGGIGVIAGAVKIGGGAFLAPGIKGAGSITIEGTLTFNTDSTYNCQLDTNAGESDTITAKAVTISSGATFSFLPLDDRALPSGVVFTVIDNQSSQPIAGTFANLPDGTTITSGSNTFRASYEGGDGNDLTLTVME